MKNSLVNFFLSILLFFATCAAMYSTMKSGKVEKPCKVLDNVQYIVSHDNGYYWATYTKSVAKCRCKQDGIIYHIVRDEILLPTEIVDLNNSKTEREILINSVIAGLLIAIAFYCAFRRQDSIKPVLIFLLFSLSGYSQTTIKKDGTAVTKQKEPSLPKQLPTFEQTKDWITVLGEPKTKYQTTMQIDAFNEKIWYLVKIGNTWHYVGYRDMMLKICKWNKAYL